MTKQPEPISVDGPVSTKETAEMSAANSGFFSRHPSQIGPYKILRIIGRGGMGTVYRSQVVVSCEVPIGQEVALKLLRETDEKERKRFAREASYLQALRHPNIVRVLDNGEYEGQPYLVMQLIEGRHADDLLVSGKPQDQQQMADLTIQALDALHTAHLQGILHRDIKPGNIMLTPAGQVKLVDFGLAQYMDAGESHLTATGAVVGTPAYMSPEQASGRREEVGRRSDIYSMGACLYELLTGQQPFTADNSVALLRRIIEEPLVPPSRLRPDLHHDLETIVLKAMAKDWRDRYATAEAMAADLRRFRLGVRVRTARPGFLLPLLRTAWHQRATLAMIGLVLFLAVSMATLLVLNLLRQRQTPLPANQTETGTVAATTSTSTTTAPVSPGETTQPANQWVMELRQELALDDSKSELPMKDGTTLGGGLKVATLPAVSGPVRLAATVELLDATAQVELLVSDSDLGRGYRLRLDARQDSDRLVLLRDNRVVASRDLGQLTRGQPHRLMIERNQENLSAVIDRREPLRFEDIIPIDGLDADGVYLAFVPGQVRVSEVALERQRSTLYVSSLSEADSQRQRGNFTRAKDKYERFIKDNPEAAEVRDARLRIGLCLVGVANRMDAPGNVPVYEDALTHFTEVASLYRDAPRYVLTASFHAWACAVRLGRFETAEEYFEAIRRDYGLPTLLATVPEALVKDLVKDYLTRAEALGLSEPERAVRLFTTGADIAGYLKQPQAMAEAQSRAGDILMSLGRIQEAVAAYRSLTVNTSLPQPMRMLSLLKVAEAERLRGRPEAGEIAYQTVISSPGAGIDFVQWARLWLGDIHAQRGDLAQALTTWSRSTEYKTLPGRIMRNLLGGAKPLPAGDERFYANDVEYFNARLAQLRGRPTDYVDHLQKAVAIGPANDWPTPLAQRLLQDVVPPMNPEPEKPLTDEPPAAPPAP